MYGGGEVRAARQKKKEIDNNPFTTRNRIKLVAVKQIIGISPNSVGAGGEVEGEVGE